MRSQFKNVSLKQTQTNKTQGAVIYRSFPV